MVIFHHPTERIVHTMAFATPVCGALAGIINSSICPPREIDSISHRTIVSFCSEFTGTNSKKKHFSICNFFNFINRYGENKIIVLY